MGGVRTNPEELGTIRRLVSAGLSYAEVGRKIGRSSTFVQYKAKEMQVTPTGTTTEQSPRLSGRAITIDQILKLDIERDIKIKIIEALV